MADRRAIAGDWNMFCLTVVHEMGHLLGHPHSLAPGSVMAPVFADESSVPTVCRAYRRRSKRQTARLRDRPPRRARGSWRRPVKRSC